MSGGSRTAATGANQRWTPERVRQRIQLTKLVDRVQRFALGEKDPCYPDKELVMTDAQVRCALGLIAKGIPDLRHVEHSGTVTHEHFAVQATARWLGETLTERAVGAPAQPRAH